VSAYCSIEGNGKKSSEACRRSGTDLEKTDGLQRDVSHTQSLLKEGVCYAIIGRQKKSKNVVENTRYESEENAQEG